MLQRNKATHLLLGKVQLPEFQVKSKVATMANKQRKHKRSSILAKDFKLDINQFPLMQEQEGKEEEHYDDDDNDDDDDDKHAKYEKQRRQNNKELNASQSSFTKRVRVSISHTVAVSLKSSRVDAVLAAFGCAGSLAFLQFLTTHTPYEFFGSFLVGTTIKLFFNENPPSPKAFVHSSIFAVAAGHTLHFVPNFCGQYARPALLFATVLYWKLYGGMWTAANTLSMIVAVESGGWGSIVPGMRELNFFANNNHEQDDDDDSSSNKAHFPWHFLFFPYISGHLVLYGLARIMSVLRRKIRTHLIQREFITCQMMGGCFDDHWQDHIVGGAERRERLRKLFNRMDSNGDGALDVIELQAALRAATGTDISLGDTKEILQSVDSDGNGSLDFDEFCASIDKLWPE